MGSVVIFLSGVSSFGFLVGFVSAVSLTPVGGVTISTVFGGLIGIAAGYFTSKSKDSGSEALNALSSPALAISGYTLILFSSLFVGGLFAGAYSREAWLAAHERPPTLITAPWKNDQAHLPSSPEEAWKWLSFAHDASHPVLGAQGFDLWQCACCAEGLVPLAVEL